jgi:K+-sensing histidine kinase KdpD
MLNAECYSRAVLSAIARNLRSLAESLEGSLPILRPAVPEETIEAEALAAAGRDSHRLSDLTRRLLEFVEIEAGAGAPGEPADAVDVRPLVHRTSREAGDLAREQRILLSDRYPEGLPPALGRADRIESCLRIVLRTLLEGSTEGAIVTIEGAAGEGSLSVRMSSDAAPGLEGLDLEEPSGGGGSRRSGHDASPAAIGLAVARAAVLALGGDLDMEVRPRERSLGAAITIRLPAC